MKKLILLLTLPPHSKSQKQIITILFLLALSGCTKDPVQPKGEDNIRQEFTIVETNSNTPIPGVTVSAYSCTIGTNCLAPEPFLGTAITNDSGKVVFNTRSIGWLELSKDRYWPGGGPTLLTDNKFELTPFATLKVHLTWNNQYPPGSLLNLRPQIGKCNACGALTQLVLPWQRVAYFKGGGGVSNSIDWQIDSGQVQRDHPAPWSSTQSIVVNRFDTAEFEIH